MQLRRLEMQEASADFTLPAVRKARMSMCCVNPAFIPRNHRVAAADCGRAR
jgi:hypothetical protein